MLHCYSYSRSGKLTNAQDDIGCKQAATYYKHLANVTNTMEAAYNTKVKKPIIDILLMGLVNGALTVKQNMK